MSDNFVFDSSFHTLVQKAPQLLIPVINEVFGHDYPEDEPIVQYRDTHETVEHRIETDSFFKVRGHLYHVECQSTEDATMAIRMIEYDFAIALEEALLAGAPYRMKFPESCVLYLRETSVPEGHLRIEVEAPNGSVFEYQVKAIFAQAYDMDEIFAKKLLLLLPFYIMRYEKEFEAIAKSPERTEQLLAECETLRRRLEEVTVKEDKALLYEQIVELSVRVSNYLLANLEKLREEVKASMGGMIIDLMSDKIAAAEKEALARGLEEGRKEGFEQGIEQGIEHAIEAARVAGADEATIAAMRAALAHPTTT